MRQDFAFRAHDLPITDDLQGLGQALAQYQIRTVAFAPAMSLPRTTTQGAHISIGLGNYIRRSLAAFNVEIGTLSCYVNMIHPDAAERRHALDRLARYLQMAPAFGTRIVATETGSVDPAINYTEKNFSDQPFQDLLVAVAQLLPVAHASGTILALEPGVNHPLYSLDRTAALLAHFHDDPALKLILDPCNLIRPGADDVAAILDKGLDQFGDRIVAVHLKDYEWTPEAHRLIKTVVPGTGHVDVPELIAQCDRHQPYGMKCLDELSPAMLPETLALPWLAQYS